MNRNEAGWDRIVWVILGVALVIGGLVAVGGTAGHIMAAIGLIPLTTGLLGWYPIYSVLGIGTHKDDTAKTAA